MRFGVSRDGAFDLIVLVVFSVLTIGDRLVGSGVGVFRAFRLFSPGLRSLRSTSTRRTLACRRGRCGLGSFTLARGSVRLLGARLALLLPVFVDQFLAGTAPDVRLCQRNASHAPDVFFSLTSPPRLPNSYAPHRSQPKKRGLRVERTRVRREDCGQKERSRQTAGTHSGLTAMAGLQCE